jgi:hypothetical protein
MDGFFVSGDYLFRRVVMDQESRKASAMQESGKVEGDGSRGVSYEEAERRAKAFEGRMFEFVRNTVEGYPELALKKLNLNYRLLNYEWHPGINLEVTGPEIAVKAFLSHLGHALGPSSLVACELLDKTAGIALDGSAKRFYAILTNPDPNFNMANADRSFVKALVHEWASEEVKP